MRRDNNSHELFLLYVDSDLNPIYGSNLSNFDNLEELRLGFTRDTLSRVPKYLNDGTLKSWQDSSGRSVKKLLQLEISDERLNENLQLGERMIMQDEFDSARENTRTHITIEKVGEDQYKIEGLPKEEILTAREIREGLVRLKSMPSRVGVLKLDKDGKPLEKEGHHLFREGDIKAWIPASELEAYDKDDISEMSDQMDLNFEGKVDNSTRFIVIENQNTDLKKGEILDRHIAQKYMGSGAIIQRYDKYIEEREARNEPIEEEPDISVTMSSQEANQADKTKGEHFMGSNRQYFTQLIDVIYRPQRYEIRIRKEVYSLVHLFEVTPFGKRKN